MTEGRLDAARFIEQLTPDGDDDRNRIGTIPGSYTVGRPTVLFDGETVIGSKKYPCLSSYTPASGDRVLLVPVGTSYVIVGALGSSTVTTAAAPILSSPNGTRWRLGVTDSGAPNFTAV